MQSEFYNVALDRIRYSLVWEDSATLYAGLQLQPSDKVLVITSAGCNVLNALLQKPAQVTAIDLNPIQNKLLLLKKYLILNFEYSVFRGLLGLDGSETVGETWQKVAPALPDSLKAYWEPFFQNHPEGLLSAGKLESYLTSFYHTLDKEQQDQLQKLLTFETVPDQIEYFLNTLHRSGFRPQFITYFDEANLSKGRDPKLFKYALESGGEAFYNRLVKQLSETLVKDNFFFHFFFFGAKDLPENILPPCYQEQHYQTLKEQLPNLQIETGEAIDYLLSPAGQEITKASLSNIFEYTSEAEFRKVCQKLFTSGERNLQLIFWNLLQKQGIPGENDSWKTEPLSENITQTQACFYFRNARVLTPCFLTVPV
jgi:S-adenosylmethionine-diacylglycerol 3-amino-3-carboxypropyl transferase